ncbi:MAG: hypothetical protein EPN93_14690 [Spirochaetes bacterium]|nr:MAG: hypothetical protein EPN93_14690 [Spirochaetota bacterium]
MHYLVRKFGLWFLCACFLLNFPPQEVTKWFLVLNVWLFAFSLGIYLARSNGLVKISLMLKRIGYFRFLVLGGGVLLSIFIRQYVAIEYQIDFLWRQGFDWIYGSIIILLVFEITQSWQYGQRVLAFLGRHLFNVFLFHTFIFYYYWPDFIYSFSNPGLIFLVLLAICILVSISIEYAKKFLKFEPILQKIDGIQMKDRFFIGLNGQNDSIGNILKMRNRNRASKNKRKHKKTR